LGIVLRIHDWPNLESGVTMHEMSPMTFPIKGSESTIRVVIFLAPLLVVAVGSLVAVIFG
jgi:hypothetical protein